MISVKIRPLDEQDAFTSVLWRNDPEVFKYTGNIYTNQISIESELTWIRKVIANEDESRFAILADGVYVGNIYLTNITNNKAEYHIFIGNKDYWGKGVAKQASLLILDYGFAKLKLTEIFLEVRKSNVTAIKLYEKIGFSKESEDEEWIKMKILNTSY